MKDKKQPSGYTILEVMIVLAVSGVLFVIAANFINDKQARTSFPVGTNQLASNLQGVIDDVADGSYSDVNISCSGGGGAPPTITETPTGAENQGRNAACVFRGKLLHFYKDGTDYSQKYAVINLVDLRSTEGLELSKIRSNQALVQEFTIPLSLEVREVDVRALNGDRKSNGNNIGFVQSQGVSAVDGGYKSGSQTIYLVHVNSPDTESGSVTANNVNGPDRAVEQVKSFSICISDGNRYARINVGSNNSNNLTVTTKFKGTTGC